VDLYIHSPIRLHGVVLNFLSTGTNLTFMQWSSGQRSWLQIQRSRVRFPVLPDFLSTGSGTGSTKPREYN
jgi:hypothetical protein